MVVWQEIDTVLLDMDGTLLDLHFDNFFWREYLPARWGEINNLDLTASKQELMPRIENHVGTLSWYCVDFWSEELDIDIMGLKNDIEHLIQIRPHTENFLEFLQQLDKKIVMVTNAHEKLLDMKMKKTRIDRFFHEMYTAHSLGAPKEDHEFWVRLSNRLDFNPEKTVFIDDNLAVLRTARSYGIRHLLTIAQPDSRRTDKDTGEFEAVHSFMQLIQPVNG